jgi:ABC-type sulfate transport system permease component
MNTVKSTLFIYTIYSLAIAFLAWFVFVFFYQYIAAAGSFKEVLASFYNPRILSAAWLSITSACVTSIIALLLGVPLAYLYVTKNFPGKEFIKMLTIDVPQTFPPVALGIILLTMLGPHSPFHIDLSHSFTALVIAQLFIAAPFLVAFTARRFREIQESELDVIAQTLGARPSQVFTTLLVPLASKDILAGLALCWARAMGELGGSLIFAGVIPYKTETVPTFIAEHGVHEMGLALGATIIVTTASIIALILFRMLARGSTLWKVFFYRI